MLAHQHYHSGVSYQESMKTTNMEYGLNVSCETIKPLPETIPGKWFR
jgi:hypothetical protein